MIGIKELKVDSEIVREVRMVNVDELQTDYYQRDIIERRIHNKTKNFNWRAFGVICVSIKFSI